MVMAMAMVKIYLLAAEAFPTTRVTPAKLICTQNDGKWSLYRCNQLVRSEAIFRRHDYGAVYDVTGDNRKELIITGEWMATRAHL
jgi:hypothetical protein